MNPNVNVSFIRSDNVACCNYNMTMDGLSIPSLVGRGTIEVLTPPLKLVSELYTIHVMVWDAKFEKLYAAQIGMTFHVRHQVLNTHFGVFHESAEWSWRTSGGCVPSNKRGIGSGTLMMHVAVIRYGYRDQTSSGMCRRRKVLTGY